MLSMLLSSFFSQFEVNELLVKDEPLSSDDEDTDAREKPSWNILREDFMMGAKMKDWNKDSEESEDDT